MRKTRNETLFKINFLKQTFEAFKFCSDSPCCNAPSKGGDIQLFSKNYLFTADWC